METKKELLTVTRDNCETAQRFEHKTLKNRDGSPLRARRNGKTRLWVRSPEKFLIPVKYGLYDYFYIDQQNSNDWNVTQ